MRSPHDSPAEPHINTDTLNKNSISSSQGIKTNLKYIQQRQDYDTEAKRHGEGQEGVMKNWLIRKLG